MNNNNKSPISSRMYYELYLNELSSINLDYEIGDITVVVCKYKNII